MRIVPQREAGRKGGTTRDPSGMNGWSENFGLASRAQNLQTARATDKSPAVSHSQPRANKLTNKLRNSETHQTLRQLWRHTSCSGILFSVVLFHQIVRRCVGFLFFCLCAVLIGLGLISPPRHCVGLASCCSPPTTRPNTCASGGQETPNCPLVWMWATRDERPLPLTCCPGNFPAPCPLHAGIRSSRNYTDMLKSDNQPLAPWPLHLWILTLISTHWQEAQNQHLKFHTSRLCTRSTNVTQPILLGWLPPLRGRHLRLSHITLVFRFPPASRWVLSAFGGFSVRPNGRWTVGRLHPYSFTGYLRCLSCRALSVGMCQRDEMMSARRRAASPVRSLKEVDSGLTGGWQAAGSPCLTALQIFGLKQKESRPTPRLSANPAAADRRVKKKIPTRDDFEADRLSEHRCEM